MRLRDLGEFELIERIARAAHRAAPHPPGVVIPIGDDAAVLRPRPGEDVVLSTDALVEGVHFRWSGESPRALGRRAFAAAASDLAAMGARPLGFTCALAAPPSLAVRRVDALVAGLVTAGSAHGCPLVGGNLSRGRETSLTLGVLGAVRRGAALTRRGARAGDRILLTGCVGGAALALARCERGLAGRPPAPVARLAAGRALARMAGVGGCIDVSDGVEADLDHLLRPEGLSAQLDAADLPVPPGFAAACRRLGLDPRRLALAGGEDYELLFTLRPAGPSARQLARRLGVAVTEIGRVVAGRGSRRRRPGGYRHF